MIPAHRRIEFLTTAMAANGYDALVCCWPQHILALTGYAPILGESAVVFLPGGESTLIIPEAERSFAGGSWARRLETYESATLQYILAPEEALTPLLLRVCEQAGISRGVLGIEAASGIKPTAYPAMYDIAFAAADPWRRILPDATFRSAAGLLQQATAVKSPHEIERIGIACQLAERGFRAAKDAIKPGIREVEVAVAASGAIEIAGAETTGVRRVDAWAFCMSGGRSAEAYLPFQHSTGRKLMPGDAAVVHINCHADGYWTDLTRTFFVGSPSPEQERAYLSILQARQAALDAVGDGAGAADIDAAARNILSGRGYGDAFLHGVGHGVGFQPIYHGEHPVLHPASGDKLKTGMVFNIEPAVYLKQRWGIRICDVVAVCEGTLSVLSDTPRDLEWAICS